MYAFLFQSTVFKKLQRAIRTFETPQEFLDFTKKYFSTHYDPVVWPLLNLDDIDEIRCMYTNKDGICIAAKQLDSIKPKEQVVLRLRYKGINIEVMEITPKKNQNWILHTSIGRLELPEECCQFYFKPWKSQLKTTIK